MKLICLKEYITSALSHAAHIVGRNTVLPILNNVLIQTKEANVSITSTNLEMAIETYFPAKIITPGSLTLPAQFFSQLIQNFPDEKLTVEVKGLTATIYSPHHSVSLKGLPVKDFPPIPKIDAKNHFEVEVDECVSLLKKTAPMAAQTETKPEFTGVLLTQEDTVLTSVATDGYRLAKKSIKIKGKKGGEEQFETIIPARTAQEVIYLFSESEGILSLYPTKNQVVFEAGNARLLSMVIEGEYPNYKAVIPTKTTTKVTLEREPFLQTLKLSGLLSAHTKEIHLATTNKKEIEIRAHDKEKGEHVSHVPAEIEGEMVATAYNYQFLTEGLSHINTRRVSIEFSGPNHATRITGIGGENYLYVVMPLKG